MFITFAAAITQFSSVPTSPIMEEAIPVVNVISSTVTVLPIDFTTAKQATITHVAFDFGCLEGVGHVFSVGRKLTEEPSPIPAIVVSVFEGDEEDTISQALDCNEKFLHPEYVPKPRSDRLKTETKCETKPRAATVTVWEDDSDDEDDDELLGTTMKRDWTIPIPTITVSFFEGDEQVGAILPIKYNTKLLVPPKPMYKKSQRVRQTKDKTTPGHKASNRPTPTKKTEESFLFDLALSTNAMFGSSRQRKTRASLKARLLDQRSRRSATFF